jgi:hypothetical protein
LGAQLADLKSEEIPSGFKDSLPANTSVCDVVKQGTNVSTCVEVGDTVYYADSGGAVAKIWVPPIAVFILNNMVLAGIAGGSIGKLAFGLRVVKKDTGKIAGVGPNIVRSLLWIVDGQPCGIPLVGLITGLTTKGHRRVGDMAAGTLVLRASAVGVPPVVPGLTAPIGMPVPAALGGYPPPPSGATGWGAPPSPTWGPQPGSAPSPDPWAPPAAPSPAPPANDPWAPSGWSTPAPPAPTPEQSAAAREPVWEPEPVREPEPVWEPTSVRSPEPEVTASEPTPQPAPEPQAAAATETPGVGAPMWDPARNAYIQWDPAAGSWMQWDDAAGRWHPIS